MQSMLPFEKNRYFPHKRMRSADFSRELEYIDHKFQFLNHWVFGAGLAVGLTVQRLDSESLLVFPGMAVDGCGRYLIVEREEVCRVRALPGFDALQGETALLFLSYQEEQKEPMFVADDQGERQEYGASVERCIFSLRDWNDQSMDEVDRLLYHSHVLCEHESIQVRQIVPQILSTQRTVVLRLVVENLSPEPVEANLHYVPQLPGFQAGSDGRSLGLDQQLELPSGTTTLEVTAVPSTAARWVYFTLSEPDFSLQFQGHTLGLKKPIQEKLELVPGDPVEAVSRKLEECSLQTLWEEEKQGIPIAALRFFRYEGGFLLDDVISLAPRRRAVLPLLQQRLETYRFFFPQTADSSGDRPNPPSQPMPTPQPDRRMATGVVTLSPSLNQRAGEVLYSREIVHGLGPGMVYADFGLERRYPAVNLHRNNTELLLGDPSLFPQHGGGLLQTPDRGIRLHPEKGTFELALRLHGPVPQTALRLRWFAWRPEDQEIPQPEPGQLLRLEPNISYAQPGGQICFVPVFQGADQPCDFFLPQRQAGVVTQDGLYTAPEREGLYQLCAQIQNRPETKVSAFIIVRAKDGETGYGTGGV